MSLVHPMVSLRVNSARARGRTDALQRVQASLDALTDEMPENTYIKLCESIRDTFNSEGPTLYNVTYVENVISPIVYGPQKVRCEHGSHKCTDVFVGVPFVVGNAASTAELFARGEQVGARERASQ